MAQRIKKHLDEEQAKVDSKKSQIKSPSSREEEDIKIRQNQINSQSRRYHGLLNEYMTCQSQFREDTKKQFIRQCQITGTQKTNQEIEELLDNDPSGALEMFSGSILQDTQAAKDKLLAVQERHGEFMKVSHILGVIFTQYRLDNTRMTHHVHSFRNQIFLLVPTKT